MTTPKLPCPCGSGKDFANCHGKADDEDDPKPEPEADARQYSPATQGQRGQPIEIPARSRLELVAGPSAGWGTSIIVPPSFWTTEDGGASDAGSSYNQGTPINVQTHIECDQVELSFSGTIASLGFTGTLRLDPPAADQLIAHVEMTTNGSVALAGDHPGEVDTSKELVVRRGWVPRRE